MKVDAKKVATFVLLFAVTGVAMASVDGTINSATSKGAKIIQAVAAGVAVMAIMFEGVMMMLKKQPALSRLGWIVGGTILVAGAAEVVNQFYGSGASAGF